MSKIQVNDIVNHFDDGAPNFPKGIVVGSGATLGFNVGTGASIYSPSDNVLTLGTNNAERLRITSAGLVGIGTDNPQGKLVVSDGANGLEFNPNSNNAIVSYNRTTSAYAPNGLQGSTVQLRIGGVGTALHVHSDGKIGIGNDNPTYKVSVKDTKADGTGVQMHLWNNSVDNTVGNVWSGIRFTGSTGDYETAEIKGWRKHPGTELNSISINTGGVERMVLSTSGVGINRTNPDQRLNVSGNIEVNAYDSAGGTGGYYTSKGLIIGNLYDAGKSYTGSDDRTGCVWQERGLDLDFATNDSLRMKITYDGLVLVGANSKRASVVTEPRFQIEGVAANNASMSITRNSGANPPYLQLAATGGSALGSVTATPNAGYLGQIVFGGSDGTQLRPGVYITCQNDSTSPWTSSSCPTKIVIGTTQINRNSPTSRFMIDDEGRLDIYSEAANAFDIHTSFTGSSVALAIKQGATNLDSGTLTCTIDADGDLKNLSNSYGPLSSDERLKQDIVDAGSQWEDIKNIRLTKFRFKNNPTGELQLGPIAQELQLVSPGLVISRPVTDEELEDTTNDLVEGDEVLTFKSSILYMKAIKALQEAITKIETLEAKVTALEGS